MWKGNRLYTEKPLWIMGHFHGLGLGVRVLDLLEKTYQQVSKKLKMWGEIV